MVVVGWKQCEPLRTLNVSQTTNSMRKSMRASAVRAVFGLPIPVLHFVPDSRTLVHLRMNFTKLNFQFFVNKCGNNCSERRLTVNVVQLQNSNLEFGITPISYTESYFRQKQHTNGQHPAEQACKIWRKNFQALLSNHILGFGSFFKAAPCIS